MDCSASESLYAGVEGAFAGNSLFLLFQVHIFWNWKYDMCESLEFKSGLQESRVTAKEGPRLALHLHWQPAQELHLLTAGVRDGRTLVNLFLIWLLEIAGPPLFSYPQLFSSLKLCWSLSLFLVLSIDISKISNIKYKSNIKYQISVLNQLQLYRSFLQRYFSVLRLSKQWSLLLRRVCRQVPGECKPG